MRAWVVRRLGGPDDLSLEELPAPPAQDGLVQIAVRASAVNFFDLLELEGTYQVKPELPFVPGAEVAGVVRQAPVGSGFKEGDRILAQVQQRGLDMGGYTELTQASPDRTVPIPDAMPFDEAAAFFVNYQTGWFGLHRRAALKAGETLLVHGGAGGVGSAAIQLGKAAGARVIATAGSDEKVELCRRLGADEAINYTTEDFADRVNQLTGRAGADVIYDPVGGDVFDRSTKCVAFEGRIVVVGFTSGRIPGPRANHLLVKNYSVVGLHWGLYGQRRPDLIQPCTDELFGLYGEGKLKPHISSRLPLEQAPAALKLLASRQATGKVVLVTDGAA
jgi:NADPH2:quinone reductase